MTKIKVFVIYLILLYGAGANAGNLTAYVGDSGDSQCTHTSIQSAIDDVNDYLYITVASGPSNNRIVYQENLTINRALVLFGGFETCSDARNGIIYSDSPMVYLQGFGNNSVVTVDSAGGSTVDMYRFEITGGLGSSGGGVYTNNSHFRLLNSLVHSNNTNSYGGGVYSYNDTLDTQNYQLEFRNTKIVGNQALLGGGGVYAQNTNVLFDEDSGVSLNWVNHSNGNGGGIHLQSSLMDFYGGTNQEPNPIDISTYRGISMNSAPQHGGGVYAQFSNLHFLGSHYQGGVNNVFGNSFTSLNINNNTADSDNNQVGDGGGIYAVGGFLSPAYISLHRARVENNSARKGGAFYIANNANFKMQRTRDQGLVQGDSSCWDEKYCSVLRNNTSGFKGGAMYFEGGVSALISQTSIYENRSDYGTVLYVDSTDSTNDIKLDQNMIYHNGRDGTGGFEDRYVIDLYNNSDTISGNNLDVTLMFNTIVDNHATQAVFAMNGVLNYLGVFSSIIHDPTSARLGDLFGAFSSAEFDCVNANETTSIGVSYATLTRMSADNPGFIVRNYDYHLKPASAMKDYCDNSRTDGIVSITNDIDDDTRAVNDTGITDFYGAWDLGADENTNSHTDLTDVIFIDSYDW